MLPPSPLFEPLSRFLERVAQLRLARVSVTARCTRALRMKDPVCAVVRGLAGEHLRELRCITRAPTCDGCTETGACDYARTFGAQPEAGDREVRPYWLAGVPATHDLAPGATFSASITTVGDASRLGPYLDVALRDALRRLGSEDDGGFDVRVVLGASRLEAPSLDVRPRDAERLRVMARTPLLLRGDLGACQAACPAAPWLALLVRAGIRRLDALLGLVDGTEQPRVAFPDLADVRVVHGRMVPWSDSRWSGRQGRRFPLVGYAGEATVEGSQLREVLPLLSALAESSVGRKTTMGFGWLTIDTPT